jgi:hypothetical protein
MYRIAAACLLASCLTASAQTSSNTLTYAPLVRARAQYDQSIAAAQARYDADVKRAREAYQRALTIVEASAAREANAAALREVEAEKKGVEGDSGDRIARLNNRLAGTTWHIHGGNPIITLQLHANHTLTDSRHNHGGMWAAVGPDKFIMLHWNTNRTVTEWTPGPDGAWARTGGRETMVSVTPSE